MEKSILFGYLCKQFRKHLIINGLRGGWSIASDKIILNSGIFRDERTVKNRILIVFQDTKEVRWFRILRS